MSFDTKAGFAGIVTATAEATGAPTGLRIADNVTLRKEGALMPRPVFSAGAYTLSRTYLAAFPYRDAMVFMGASNALYTSLQLGQLPYSAPARLAGVPAGPVRADVQSAKEARRNLYVPYEMGVLKLATAVGSLETTGTSPNAATVQSITATAGSLLAANQKVGYRLVTVCTDVNGVIIRSRPSGVVSFTATDRKSVV